MFVSRKQLKRLIGESLKVRQQSSAVTMTPSRLEKIISEEVVRLFEQASSGADPDGIYRDPSDPNYEYRVQAGEWEGRNRGGTSWVKMAGFGDAVAVLTARWPDAIAAVAEPAIEPAAEPAVEPAVEPAIEPAVDDADGRRIQLDPMFIPPEEWSSQDGRLALRNSVLRGEHLKGGRFVETSDLPGWEDEGKKRDVGSYGPAVVYVQQMLGLPTTGFFGHGTYKAVQQLQRDKGLTSNGVIEKWTAQVILTLPAPLDYSRVYEEAGGDIDLSPESDIRGVRTPIPGEGSIDGMSPEAWLESYWEARTGGPHLSGRGIDLDNTLGILEVITDTFEYAELSNALDETQEAAVTFTGDAGYTAPEGGSSNPHYHLEVTSVLPSGRALIDEQLGAEGNWREYVNVVPQANMGDIQPVTLEYVKLVAAIVKRGREADVEVATPIVTSAFRTPAQQARIMIRNAQDRIEDGKDPTAYLVGLYRDDVMAKALGHALEGRYVTTTGDIDAVALASIEDRDPSEFDPTEVA